MSRVAGTGVEPLVLLHDVTFRYDDRPAVAEVSLRIDHGEFTGIVGPSGSGKTTLLRLLLGTVRPTAGRVQRAARTAVSYVPQLETVDWNFPITVAECVLMARRSGRLRPWADRSERAEVAAVLDRLGIADLGHRHIRELSGGQQQRMFIARALLRRPALLLMDEPTSGVDIATRHEVLHLLGDLNADGLAIVLTTHDLNGMAAHLPSLVCLNRRVIAHGSPHEVLTPAVLEATFGAEMEVLEHLGMLVVVDPHAAGLSASARPA